MAWQRRSGRAHTPSGPERVFPPARVVSIRPARPCLPSIVEREAAAAFQTNRFGQFWGHVSEA